MILSVDLGTSNTVAVLSAHDRLHVVELDGSPVLPSAVFAAADGQVVVGREAERLARLEPARFEPNPKRRVDEGELLLGDRVVPVTAALAAVLGKVAGEVARQLGGVPPAAVRLTCPAQWGPVRRNVLLSAARRAGLGANLVLVPEPVAAAAHFASFPGRALAPGQVLAVYDLGAGTFDVAVVGASSNGFVVLAESGLPDLGGLDVDQALLTHVGRQVSRRDPHGWQRLMMPVSTGDRRAQRALREDIRAAKEALSSRPQTEVPLPEPFGDVLVTRDELESLVRPNLVRSTDLLASTVRSAGLGADNLAGIYLVGGSSRIPLVATLIGERLGVVPTNLDQPETAVALGAHHVTDDGISLRTETLVSAVPRQQSWTPTPKPARRKRWSWKKVGIACAVFLVVAVIGLATWRVIAIMTPQGLPATGKAPPAECALSGDTLRALHITNVQEGNTVEDWPEGVRSETTCKFVTLEGSNGSAFRSLEVDRQVAADKRGATKAYDEGLRYYGIVLEHGSPVANLGDRAAMYSWGNGSYTNVAVLVQVENTVFGMVYFGNETSFFGTSEVPVSPMRDGLMRAAREMAEAAAT